MCTLPDPPCARDLAPLWLSSAQARLSFGSALLRSAHPCSASAQFSSVLARGLKSAPGL
ncbi:uncharacterized protein BDZ99DRAFT_457683 [Mytilinidion resinicola]|uniref:Uncharacterized protein n=1 Tax=Mytilinidion resinicola TaxID=574789 RepID=A0A6A6Z663_9PEZI|nr:uncharacterized protein BDZ99DRAFT_457683 [Mytilinidion resinicola]KAF2815715.1 hypothetical protein BDZ99DRAFT_457683 [Mytilinidion resinicola]